MRIEAEGQEIIIKNNKGDVAIIPKTHRKEAMRYLENGNHSALDKLIEGLPSMEDYAEDGTLIPKDPPVTPVPLIQPASKVAPFNTEWLNDPKGITKAKYEQQLGVGSWDKQVAEIKRSKVVDINQLAGKNPYNLVEANANELNVPNVNATKGKNAIAAIQKLQSYIPDPNTKGISQLKSGTDIVGVKMQAENPDAKGEVTHEQLHNNMQWAMEKFIKDKWGSKKLTEEQLKAIGINKGAEKTNQRNFYEYSRSEAGNTEGIYPTIMQARQRLSKKPGEIWTKEDLNAPELQGEGSPVRFMRYNYDDETILDILNTVAENKQPDTGLTYV